MSTKSKILIFDAEVDIQGQQLQHYKNVHLAEDDRHRLILFPKHGDSYAPLVTMRVVDSFHSPMMMRFGGFIPLNTVRNDQGKIRSDTWVPGSIIILAPSEDEKE